MAQRPSEMLRDLATTFEPSVYLEIVEKHINPFLDSLPSKETTELVSVIEKAHKEYSSVAQIAYSDTERRLKADLKALEDHVKNNWYGYETQSEMMDSIVQKIGDWLQISWTVGFETGREHRLVHKSLQLCYSIVRSLLSSKSQADFDQMVAAIEIQNSSGTLVYESEIGTAKDAIVWVWRELLVSVMVPDTDSALILLNDLTADVERLGLSDELLKRLDVIKSPAPYPGPHEYDEEGERNLYRMNAHWSSKHIAAVPKVRSSLCSVRLQKFNDTPSYELYKSLVSAAPECKDTLVTSVRFKLIQGQTQKPSVKTHEAFKIFLSAHADQDLFDLIAMNEDVRNDWEYTDDLRKSIPYLATRGDTVRSRALELLMENLKDAQQPILDAIEDVFDDIPTAWAYLVEEVTSGRLPAVATVAEAPPPSKRPKYETVLGVYPAIPDPVRDPILKEFCDKAGWSTFMQCDSDEDDDMGYDSDSETIGFKWVKLLDSWPDVKEREAMKKSLRETWSETGGKWLFGVDGVADALARRCDWGSEPCRQVLGRAIRELYFSFAEDGPEKDRIKKNMPSKMVFHETRDQVSLRSTGLLF